jgi:hypothetical protein
MDVGLLLGAFVGSNVGIALGYGVGPTVGNMLGSSEGANVGKRVGLSDGFQVGEKVGTGEGNLPRMRREYDEKKGAVRASAREALFVKGRHPPATHS